MLEIVQQENPVLRSTAKEVKIDEIQAPEITGVLKRMSESLSTQNDGVALAAPQIGESLRIFIVSGKVFDKDFGTDNFDESKKYKDLIFINPEIIKLSKKKELFPEGCLSVRFWYGNVERSTQATIRAYDENGKQFERGASGLLAQIFQHEIDHLNGILFTDKAGDLEEITPSP